MLGADHHIARLKAAAAAAVTTRTVEVLIGADGEPGPRRPTGPDEQTCEAPCSPSTTWSKAIGAWTPHYNLIPHSVDTAIDIDLALWSSASNENPVYYVQRACPALSAGSQRHRTRPDPDYKPRTS